MFNENVNLIISEIESVLKMVDSSQINKVSNAIENSPQVFFAGVGRSGYIVRSFAMRLMHAGIKSYVVTDTTTTSAKAGDLLIVGSCSGETSAIKAYVEKAKKIGMTVIIFTGFKNSSIAKISDIIVQIPAGSPKSNSDEKIYISKQPMANLFEQALLICFDALFFSIATNMQLDVDKLFERHANLE